MIFSTSRGKDLDLYITAKSETVVFSKSGCKLPKIMRDIQEKIPKYKKKYKLIHVYFLIGIPDITTMVRGDDYEEVIFDLPNTIPITEKFKELINLTKSLGGIPCLCTVASMDLKVWNNHRLAENKTTHLRFKEQYQEMQKKLENSIIQINKIIIETNITNEMHTPLISDTI